MYVDMPVNYGQQITDWAFKTDQQTSITLKWQALGSWGEALSIERSLALPSPSHPLYSAAYVPPPFPGGKRRNKSMCVSPVTLLIICNDLTARCKGMLSNLTTALHTANHGAFDHNMLNSSGCILKIIRPINPHLSPHPRHISNPDRASSGGGRHQPTEL